MEVKHVSRLFYELTLYTDYLWIFRIQDVTIQLDVILQVAIGSVSMWLVPSTMKTENGFSHILNIRTKSLEKVNWLCL